MTHIPSDLASCLRNAQGVVVITGAGVSAESKVPTFRDPNIEDPDMLALWREFDPQTLATPEAFAQDPERVTRWYDLRRTHLASCEPNPAHRALAEIESLLTAAGRSFTLVTQNVDRLHHAAGSRRVFELHGNLREWRCTRCAETRAEPGPAFTEYPPPCVSCGGPRRPCVVWFGEALPEDALEAAFEAISACDLFLSIGTSAVVYPAAGLIHVAAQAGARTAELNKDDTPQSRAVDWSLRGRAGELVPALVSAAWPG